LCKNSGFVERLSKPECSKIKSFFLKHFPSIEKVARVELTNQIMDAVKREKENKKAANKVPNAAKNVKARLGDMSGSFLLEVVDEEIATKNYQKVLRELHFLPWLVMGTLGVSSLGFVLVSPVVGVLLTVATTALSASWAYL
jgi:hypothetical protein